MTNTAPYSLLISDLHLCDAHQDLTAAFQHFCKEKATQAEALFILGDLSDAWVGDDDDGDTANTIRQTLKTVAAQGTAVYLMSGNRDFLMGAQLAEDCGASVLADPSVVNLHGNDALLLHGDSLCIDDSEYMAFRAQIQNPSAQQILLSKPLEERRQIAAMLRSQSKSANSNKAEDIMDVNQDEVVKQLENANVKLMIHGHTHRPAEHELQIASGTAKRLVLGDWGESIWYIKADQQGQTLHSYPATTNENELEQA